MDYISFSWWDYFLFCFMLTLSTIIGVYHGCFSSTQQTPADYLYGGRKLKIFPVTMSLLASYLSGVALLGVPSEVYVHGTQYWIVVFPLFITGLIIRYTFLPVFHKLQLASIYEYFEIRFDRRVRIIASFLYVVLIILYLPIVIYSPSLALNQVTGINLYLIVFLMTTICVFYTSIGGLKAVVWADTLQYSVTLCTLGFTLILGSISVGGFQEIWKTAQLGERLEFFNLNPDPTARATFWSVLLGQTFICTSYVGIEPAAVQRFLAVPSLKDAKRVLMIYTVVTIITESVNCFSGLIIYAKYHDCDPLSAGLIQRADQILPYYVLDVAKEITGLSGLFIAGLFSTSLSSFSSYLNVLSEIIYTDFVLPFTKLKPSEPQAGSILKIITVILGIVSVSLVLVVEKLGSVFELCTTFCGITSGTLLGLFAMGMMFRFANTKGALFGGIASFSLMSIIILKAQMYVWNGDVSYSPKAMRVDGCNGTVVINERPKPDNEPFWLFRISFHYYILMGTITTLVLGLLMSWFTRKYDDKEVDINLLCPFVLSAKEKERSKTSGLEMENPQN